MTAKELNRDVQPIVVIIISAYMILSGKKRNCPGPLGSGRIK
jgi:hypothetical protein